MAMYKSSFFLAFLCAIILNSCMTYGDTTNSSFKGNEYRNRKPESFYMFFETDSIDFDYESLGKVKTVSNRTDLDTEVLERMAYEAWSNGANTILFIKYSTQERTEGTFDLLLDSEEEEENSEIYYDAIVYEGMASYVNVTPEFKEQYGEGIDLFYVKKVEQDLTKESNRKGGEAVMLLVGGIVSLVALIISPDEDE